MRPYAITEDSKTWCGWRQGEKVYGYQDENSLFYWFKTKRTAKKYAEIYGKQHEVYHATLQETNEATIYKYNKLDDLPF